MTSLKLYMVILSTAIQHIQCTQWLACEDITIQLCKAMPWNMTRMPNLMGQGSQVNAALKFDEYSLLIMDQCSDELLFFLCALFVPICSPTHEEPIPPCREVCEAAKTGCEPVIISKYNRTWPRDIDCNTYPEYTNDICVSPRAFLRNPDEPDTSQEVSNTESCDCRRQTKLHIRKYVRTNLDYVIRVTVTGVGRISTDTILSVDIKKILKNKSDLRLRRNESLMLFTEDNKCNGPCPVAKKHKDYIIACKKIVNSSGRLIFDINMCMISRWKESWIATIELWDRIAAMPEDAKQTEIRRMRMKQRQQRQIREEDT